MEEVDSETKIVIKRIYVFGEGEGIITGRLSGFTSWFQNEWIVGMTRASIDEKIAVECGLLFFSIFCNAFDARKFPFGADF